ncbi:MAG: hypothetical protein GXY81_02295 [Candidatus Cloacimonetes bacterium]|nr:hypothetical protein [Candidatus Cloacimonadota bacterium]
MELKKTILPLLLVLLALSGCIRKNNPTGNNWSDVRPMTTVDSLQVFGGYSFAGSAKIKGTESSLLCGNFEGIESVTFMRFTALPEVGKFRIPDYQDSTFLSLTLTKRSPARRNPLELKIYKLNQSWAADSTGLIDDANLTLITPIAFTVPDTISTLGTQVKIPIPAAALENWRSEADTLGLTLAIKAEAGSWVEMMSMETGRGPQLRFRYRITDPEPTEGSDDSIYEQRPTRDSYRIDEQTAPLLADRWVLNNINPSRFFVDFNIRNDWFKDMQGNVLDEKQRKRVTINQAKLVFYVKENPYYGSIASVKLRADRMNDSLNVAEPVVIDDSRLTSGFVSDQFVRGDSIEVDVTAIIQAYSSGKKLPYGIVVRSMQELQNYGRLELWHFSDAPADKRPKIKITYTPPFL